MIRLYRFSSAPHQQPYPAQCPAASAHTPSANGSRPDQTRADQTRPDRTRRAAAAAAGREITGRRRRQAMCARSVCGCVGSAGGGAPFLPRRRPSRSVAAAHCALTRPHAKTGHAPPPNRSAGGARANLSSRSEQRPTPAAANQRAGSEANGPPMALLTAGGEVGGGGPVPARPHRSGANVNSNPNQVGRRSTNSPRLVRGV